MKILNGFLDWLFDQENEALESEWRHQMKLLNEDPAIIWFFESLKEAENNK